MSPLLCIISGLLVSFELTATTFLPIPFEKQVRESDGAVLARYQGRQYKRLGEGKVFTEASFEVLKHTGLNNNQIINKNNFHVLYPGGSWNGMEYQVHGTPEFQKGETYLLLLTEGRDGHAVTNLSLGQYNFTQTKEEEDHISSTVFPDHVSLGKIEMSRVNEILAGEYGKPLQKLESDLFVHRDLSGKSPASFSQNLKDSPSQGRSPATIRERRPATKSHRNDYSTIYWVVGAFFSLAIVASFKRRKKS